MPILALDTSVGCVVAVVDDDGAVLARAGETVARRHAELLAPLIDGALHEAGVRPGDLSAVVVGTGPAPFTGLRAGLVTARTFGFALGIPVLGVPSLEALALRALDRLDLADAPADQVLVLTDARRHEVYWGRYVRDEALGVRAVAGPDVGPADSLDTVGAVLVGPAAAALGARVAEGDEAVDPVALAAVALARRAHQVPTPVEPLYLRRPDAVPSAGAKRVLG
ncbi:MAG: tRNA (adenosine(37)-N6)-threonylcarbamoyltransferase complex dimerization subunit type 1 TsaB [Actinobacteria bacterium]|nr:tRNA (adenosine(37)-N6)-threonylcarbamoyltransferase complex dimerization subunit type 1 TsaB [Actinomycetota bacterium]MCG2800246.1 tRNA (adenosine(37)-N6)-threonylcarbamoyltransferase complex dimerization subunit type 1 TsaB [Cellulomonas sp.]